MNKQQFDDFMKYTRELEDKVTLMINTNIDDIHKHRAVRIQIRFGYSSLEFSYFRFDTKLGGLDYNVRLPLELIFADDYRERGSKIIDEMETEQKLAYLLKNAKI